MALKFQTTEIPFGALDQKSSGITRPNGALEHAINVEFDKVGVLNKRRGYQYVDVGETVNRLFTDDQVMMHITAYDDLLVIFTYDFIAELGDKDMLLEQFGGNATVIYRGPNNRGNARLRHISTSRMAQGADGDLP